MVMTGSDISEDFRSRYELRRELGKGGMGEVRLAFDTWRQLEVAVKFTRLQALQDERDGQRLRRMWLNETRLAGRLHHPCIAETYESGVTGEYGYLVMEYVAGSTLRQHVAPDRLLALDVLIDVLYKVCSALDYANRMGLLHRDIKPANVMYTPEGGVKVMDFGAAYYVEADETQVFDVGTLPFMPPEHFKRSPPTLQSDIYAVGVMAYQLLTGALPYEATSYESLIYQKLYEDFVPLEQRRKQIPPELRFAVHRAIHRDIEVRYTNWSEFGDALALVLPRLGLPRAVRFDSTRFQQLRKLAFFSAFSDAQLWETIHLSSDVELTAGDVLFEEGAAGRNIYVIISGEMMVVREGVELNRMAAGDCFGEVAYVDEAQQARTATVRAADDAVLLEIDADALRQASSGLQAAFGRAFMAVLVSRLKRADRRYLDAMRGVQGHRE